MTRRIVPLAAAGFLAVLLLAGCTRTVYVVQNPDGSFSEVPYEEPEPDPDAYVIEDDTLIVDVLPSQDYLLVEDECGRLYLQIELIGQEIVVEERAPMNLSIVIDRSGSMTGGKLEDARRAALWLVDHLADGDRVSIVSYASDVSVDVPSTRVGPHTRGRLARAIDRLYAAGGTYLSGGLEAGAHEVQRGWDRELLNRVILMSDGNANVGTTDVFALERMADRLRREGVTVTTMGVGLDYNEDLMTSVAVAGAGHYYFIERSGELERMFGRELDGLARTVARDAVLELDLPDDIIVEDVYGYRHESFRGGVRIPMSSVAAGEKRRLLMSLKMPRGRQGSDVTVASGRLTFRDEVKKRDRSLSLKPVKVRYTSDRRVAQRSVNRKVVEKLEAVRNAQVRKEALRRLDRGDRAGAQQIVRRRAQQAKKAAKTFGGAELAKEADSIFDFEDEVQAAPAPSSSDYKRMKKSNKARAHSAEMY